MISTRIFFLISIVAICTSFSLATKILYAGTLTCSVTTAAGCAGTVIYRMSSTTNAHAELPNQATAAYANSVVCCTGVVGLGNSCTGSLKATVLKLSSSTNAHAELATQNNYSTSTCISVGASGYASVGYQSSNCTGYDTTLGSIESVTNSHVGDSNAYTTKICASASSTPLIQTLTFTLSTTTVYFGTLLSSQTRYASSTGQGDSAEVEAFNLRVKTNASSGYFVTVKGATLTYGSSTITAIGNTNTAPSVGVKQFGMRATVSGSNGIVVSPYDGSGFAYAASATAASQVGSSSFGDNATSTFSVRLVANIGALTEAGAYTTSLVYVATANY